MRTFSDFNLEELRKMAAAYEEVREEGNYNMITEAGDVIRHINEKYSLNMTTGDYTFIIQNYDVLCL